MPRCLFVALLGSFLIMLMMTALYGYHFAAWVRHPPQTAELEQQVAWSALRLLVRSVAILLGLAALLRCRQQRTLYSTLIACVGVLMLDVVAGFPAVRTVMFGPQAAPVDGVAFIFAEFFWLGFLLWRLIANDQRHRRAGHHLDAI